MSVRVNSFLSMLARGQDSALLRFSLGNEYLAAGEPVEAALHLQSAVDQDRDYSAAWKLLGKAHAEARDNEKAITAYTQGIEIAEENGDRQAAKEMRVFLKRLNKSMVTG